MEVVGKSNILVYGEEIQRGSRVGPNLKKCLCLLSDLQGVSLVKTSTQRKQVQSHAMNSSTPHVFNTPATLNTRHRPNLIEYDGARDDPLKMSAVRDRKKRG